jgi:hypothetical protein
LNNLIFFIYCSSRFSTYFSFFLSLSPSFFLRLSASPSFSVFLSPSFSVFLSPSFFLRHSFSVILSPSFFLRLSFSVILSPSFFLHLSFSRLSPSFSVSLRLSPCFSVFLRVSPCFSVFLRVSPCFSVFLRVSPCFSVFLRVSHIFRKKKKILIFEDLIFLVGGNMQLANMNPSNTNALFGNVMFLNTSVSVANLDGGVNILVSMPSLSFYFFLFPLLSFAYYYLFLFYDPLRPFLFVLFYKGKIPMEIPTISGNICRFFLPLSLIFFAHNKISY